MRFLRELLTLIALAGFANASTISYSGMFSSPDSPVEFLVSVPTAGTVTFQTYGFGGGDSAAGVVAAGGTDPFLAIFSGTGSDAAIVTDGLGDPFGTSLTLNNYESFAGCPPANAPDIGGSPQCGDIRMSVVLAAGTYTVILADGQYIANAVFSNGTLGEGFSDFTGGNFCNIVINDVACGNTSGAYALDISSGNADVVVPEPVSTAVVSSGLAGLLLLGAWRHRSLLRN